MKRSQRASLLLMGATPFLMLACEKREQGLVYRSAEECKEARHLTPGECDREFEWASDENERIAPRYEDREECDADFGAYGCEARSGYYSPRMTGMFARHLLGTGGQMSALRNPQPLYEAINDRGMLRTADNVQVSRQTGLVDLSSSVFHPIQGARALSRGGFGRQWLGRAALPSSWQYGG